MTSFIVTKASPDIININTPRFLIQDFAQALAFMGYEPGRWAAGFNDLEDIFEFVASSAIKYPAPCQ